MSDEKMLVACINEHVVGYLRDEGGFWTFEYDQNWIARPDNYPISPALPVRQEKFVDAGSERPVQWFFDNLLPEEAARRLLAKEARVGVDNAWDMLAYFGAESAGAITLLPIDAKMTKSGFAQLTNEELQHRIDQMPQHSLSENSPKRMSLAGAQHKLAVTIKDGDLFEPFGVECSTHILKPDSKAQGYPHTAINEYFCMQLAKAAGLSVPDTELRYVPSPIYLVKRFDRKFDTDPLERIHMFDAMQLLSLDKDFKYVKASSESLDRCLELCRAKIASRQSVFKWVAFNVLTGNGDAHLKNISFTIDGAGIALSPFYDLVSTVVYTTREHDLQGPHFPNVNLSMPLGKAHTFSDVTRQDLMEFAQGIHLREKVAAKILDSMIEKVVSESARIYHDLERRSDVRPGELRLVRTIISLPIREMAPKLRIGRTDAPPPP